LSGIGWPRDLFVKNVSPVDCFHPVKLIITVSLRPGAAALSLVTSFLYLSPDFVVTTSAGGFLMSSGGVICCDCRGGCFAIPAEPMVAAFAAGSGLSLVCFPSSAR
jgi:hypothetical protein